MTTTINQRFSGVHRYSGLSMRKFADVIGISQPSAKAIIDGDNAPSFKAIDGLLIGFPNVSAEWLLRGKGTMLLPESNTNELRSDCEEIPQEIKGITEPTAIGEAAFNKAHQEALNLLIERKIEAALKRKGIG